MKFYQLFVILKHALSIIYEDRKFNEKIFKGKIIFDGNAPSRLACVQRALFNKADAVYNDGKCKIVVENHLVAGSYFQAVGNIDKQGEPPIKEKWKIKKMIVNDIRRPVQNTIVTRSKLFNDEYKLSMQIMLKSFAGGGEYKDFIQFLGDVGDFDQMIKVKNYGDLLVLDYMINDKTYVLKTSPMAKPDLQPTIVLNKWFSVEVVQEKEGADYFGRVYFDGVLMINVAVGKKAPIWKSDVHVYVSNPWNAPVDGFVRNVTLYEKNDKD